MATDSYWQLEKEYYALAEEYDVIIRIVEHEDVVIIEGEGSAKRQKVVSVPKKLHEFKVKRNLLSAASDFLRTFLNPDSGFKEAQQSVVDVHEDFAEALCVWFKIIHSHDVESTFATTDTSRVWEMLAVAHKYGLTPKSFLAKSWFQTWYKVWTSNEAPEKFDFNAYRMLMLPCHAFDHAVAFADTTKYLGYNATGHITEKRPDGFKVENLHVDSSVIQQVNAAKGRLKTIIHRHLYTPIASLLKLAKCDCKEKTLYGYEKALFNTGAWPLETAFLRRSTHDILCKLEKFEAPSVGEMCNHCYSDFAGVVHGAVSKTKNYFDGLCLDCMNASNPKFGDADEDYWNHALTGYKWDETCRFSHDQPSWYFSFMGRREKMIQWQKRNDKKREDPTDGVWGWWF